MRTTRPYLWAVPAALLAAACSGAPDREGSEISADLRRDLELAQSAQLELAPNRQRTDVASAIEIARPGTTADGDRAAQPMPRRDRPKARVVSSDPRPDPVAEAPVAAEASESRAPTVSDAEAALAEASPEPAEVGPAEEPEVLAGPQITPEGVGTARPRDPGGWGDDVPAPRPGVVVVRGGDVGDDDHCQYHPRGGVPISIGRRYPGSTVPIFGGGRTIGGGRGAPAPTVSGPQRTRAGGSTIRGRGAPTAMPATGSTGRRRM